MSAKGFLQGNLPYHLLESYLKLKAKTYALGQNILVVIEKINHEFASFHSQNLCTRVSKMHGQTDACPRKFL